MIVKLLPLAILQSVLLALGQVFLKVGLQRMLPFEWTLEFWRSFWTNWQFALCGICFVSSGILWMYIIKSFPLSIAYPMVSLSYVFGMIAAIFVFHENVDIVKWIGAFLIIVGCILIAK